MRATILFTLVLLAGNANALNSERLENIQANSIYSHLLGNGFSPEQEFIVKYRSVTGEFKRDAQGLMQPILRESTESPPTVPKIGDVKTYETERESEGMIYQYTFEYTYMRVDGIDQWVLTQSVKIFIGLKRDKIKKGGGE